MKEKMKDRLVKKDIEKKLREYILKILKSEELFLVMPTKEPFYNIYSDKISYDYSGEAKPLSSSNLQEFKSQFKNLTEVGYSKLEALLWTVTEDNWMASYESNRGKNWVSFYDNVFNYWNELVFELFRDINLEDHPELDDFLVDESNLMFYDFLNYENHKPYYEIIMKRVTK